MLRVHGSTLYQDQKDSRKSSNNCSSFYVLSSQYLQAYSEAMRALSVANYFLRKNFKTNVPSEERLYTRFLHACKSFKEVACQEPEFNVEELRQTILELEGKALPYVY